MSRHRLVRNLDLDAEMNDGSDSENELENEWDAMTPDQRVLMDSGLEHVRSLLGGDGATSDLTDKQIKDSLWYYYFDADKTVAWLIEEKEKARKKAEKKNHVEPMDEDVAPPAPPSPPLIASAPSLPLTALQRLSLSRQAKSNLPSKSPSSATSSSATSPHIVFDQPQPKLSKLALLAKSRAAAASSPATTTTPTPTPTPQEPAPSSLKPLSKLQLKLLAAKEAKALLALPPAPPPPPPPPHPSTSCFLPPSSNILLQPTSFGRLLALPRSSPKLLKLEPPAGRTDIFSVLDVMGVERETIAKVFEGESPDDVVLRKREGTKLARAGGLEVAGKV